MLPRQIGSVRILERLGEGGMAVVHRAADVFRPERQFAVKFLKGDVAADAEVSRRFLREGEVLKGLRHPHLVEVYDFGRAGTVPYLLMELLAGGSIKASFGEPPATLVARLAPVADALAHAHSHGVVHRDLKPSNLLFTLDGRVKVTDFGVCLWEGAEGTRVTRSQMVVGTLGYMAPEQHGDPRTVDGRCDVYALAAILYEFCTGQNYSQIQVPPAAARPGFPLRLARILIQGLAAQPARRTASMAQFRDELLGWLETAEAAGWGAEALPGFTLADQEEATVARRAGAVEGGSERLAPYLDALAAGGVGARRSAADALIREARPEDEPFLLDRLAVIPEGGRFAVVAALGRIGGGSSFERLRGLLGDPFARAEASDALAALALRLERRDEALALLREEGLGAPWRWESRTRLGDDAWVEALQAAWLTLSPPLKTQALQAALALPETLRKPLKEALAREAARGHLKQLWSEL